MEQGNNQFFHQLKSQLLFRQSTSLLAAQRAAAQETGEEIELKWPKVSHDCNWFFSAVQRKYLIYGREPSGSQTRKWIKSSV